VHTSAKARLTIVANPDRIRIRILIRVPDRTDPDRHFQSPKFNHLFTGRLPTFPENFMQIRLEVFVQSCQQTDRQTTTKTYPLLAEVIIFQLADPWGSTLRVSFSIAYSVFIFVVCIQPTLWWPRLIKKATRRRSRMWLDDIKQRTSLGRYELEETKRGAEDCDVWKKHGLLTFHIRRWHKVMTPCWSNIPVHRFWLVYGHGLSGNLYFTNKW